MVKQLEQTHRFIIAAEVEMNEVGPLLAQLTLMGFEKISHELITDVHTYKRNGKRAEKPAEEATPVVKREKTVREFAVKWIEQHPSFAVIDLCAAVGAQGWASTNAYKACHDLVEAGMLRKLGEGHYQRADIKALAPPPVDLSASPKARNKTGRTSPHSGANFNRRYNPSNRELVLRYIGKRKTVSVKELRQLLVENDRPEKSASPVIAVMSAEGLLKQKVPGEYDVTEQGSAKARSVYERLRRQGKKVGEEAHA